MILKSFFPDVVIPDKPLGQFVVDCLEKFGEHVAMVEIHSGKEVTFKQLKDETLKMVRLLWKAGLRKGDIVGLVMPFDMHYVPLFIAIIYCGGVLFGTKLLYKSSIHNQLAAMKPVLVITTNDRYEELSEDMKSHVSNVKLCLSFEQLQHIKPGSLRTVDDDLPCYGAIDVHNDPAIIFQSSGTTGEPKGIVITHYGMMAAVHIIISSGKASLGDVSGSINSIIHLQSLSNMLVCLCSGMKLVYANSLSAEQHFAAVSKYKVNSLGILNVNILRGIIKQKVLEPERDLSSLQSVIVGGTSFPPDLIQEAREKLGTVVTMVYGMTEAGLVTIGFSNRVPCNSVGLLLSNLELKIVDKDSGKELDCGEKGEICIRGPQITKQYIQPDGTRLDGLKNEWLHSGDLGFYDRNGYVYVVGRAKEAIKIQPGNVTVMPAELDDILLRHKQISDVAVAGVPHPDHGEAPRAFVVRKDDKLTEKEVVEFFESETNHVTSLQGGVQFVDVIPRTELGKPLRRKLIESVKTD